MKKSLGFIGYLLLFIAISFGAIKVIDNIYYKKLESKYFDSLGNMLLPEKNQGLALQKIALSKNDTLGIYGSSELSTSDIPSNPMNQFNNKASGFQVMAIGRGYSQSLIHAINFAALNKDLKNQKLVVIISPQWFTTNGLEPGNFPVNFSELQFYSLMLDKNVSADTKKYIAQRVSTLSEGNEQLASVNKYAKEINSDKITYKALGIINTPYYWMKYNVLKVKDKRVSLGVLNKQSSDTETQNIPDGNKVFNWSEEINKEETLAKEKTKNQFNIDNDYYNKYIKENLEKTKGSLKGQSYVESPEYGDLQVLLNICKESGVKPLFVSVPVNGAWYDYCEFPKDDMQAYYKKVNNLITSNGFEVLDLSEHENEPYFLKDTMHLGWKGWVYIDQKIDEYYHEGR